jgi:hypothetical protein
MIRQIFTATMGPDLVTIQELGSLSKSFLELSSNALSPLEGKDSKGKNFGFSQVFTFPLNCRTIHVWSNILEHETQKAYNLYSVQCDQNMRAGMPLGSESEPNPLVELTDKFQQF